MSVEPVDAPHSERLVEPTPPLTLQAGLRRAAIIALCLLLNLAIFAGFFIEAFFDSPEGETVRETPVEVVVVPPPAVKEPIPPRPEEAPKIPKPEPEPPKQKPKNPTDLDVKFADDAPRDGGQEQAQKEQKNASDAKIQAPRLAQPEKQAASTPEKSVRETADQDMALRTEPPSLEKPSDDPEAEITENLNPQDKASKQRKTGGDQKLKPQKGEKLRQDLAAAFENTPEFHIAPPSKPSKTSRGPGRASVVSGGNADPSYIAVVYGLILKKFTRPAVLSHPRKANTVVAFAINPNGVLVETELLQTGGAPELDAAVISAIRRASPFPPTPNAETLGFIYSGPDKDKEN